MVASMTAYSREQVRTKWGEAICEIRTLNHRYLELAIRLPDSLKALDYPIRKKIASRLKRGKIDCVIHYKAPEKDNGTFAINDGLVRQIIAAAEAIAQETNASAINPLDILRWPGVISENELELGPDHIGADILMLLDKTLDAITQTRDREGEKIKGLIEQRCKAVQQKIIAIQKELPAVREMQRERIINQISKLQVELDHDKLEQEILFLARKQDIAEELDRLTVHIEEVIRVLAQTGPNGHRLDFLMQEMRRETNPLGAKSTHTGITNAAVDLKVLIEQMREQIQNIE